MKHPQRSRQTVRVLRRHRSFGPHVVVPRYRSCMVHLWNICDPGLLDEAIRAGFVSVRRDGRLRILNYTPKTTYARAWNEATSACRGLILDDSDRVVSRPFPKFFGPSEPDAPAIPMGQDMEVTAKLDGSLGIAYTHPEGGVRVATRGSLTSDQAIEATRIWHEKYRQVVIPEGVTPLFEIIYPDNRIVVDYGEMRDLVLIALIDIATGADVDTARFDWPGPRAETVRFADFGALMDHVFSGGGSDSEGYVARFVTDEERAHTRFKLKFPAYVAAHRVVFGLTSTRVWEAAAVGAAAEMGVEVKAMISRLRLSPETIAGLLGHGADPVGGLRGTLPEEFLPWYDSAVAEVRAVADGLIRRYEEMTREALDGAVDDSDRSFAASAKALAAKHSMHPGPMFALRNGRVGAHLAIWGQTKPRGHGERPTGDAETVAVT